METVRAGLSQSGRGRQGATDSDANLSISSVTTVPHGDWPVVVIQRSVAATVGGGVNCLRKCKMWESVRIRSSGRRNPDTCSDVIPTRKSDGSYSVRYYHTAARALGSGSTSKQINDK